MTQRTDIDPLRDLQFLAVAEPLFDTLTDVVFFVKDADARYVAVNDTLVHRCGLGAKEDLLGKTTLDVFAPPFGQAYHDQDRRVIADAVPLKHQLELHLYVRGGAGWCITSKLPLRDGNGRVLGIVGVSDDIHASAEQDSGFGELARGIAYIREHIDQPLRVEQLAALCGLSTYRFEHRMKKVFQITAGQFIGKTRIDAACRLLQAGRQPIVDVALACGFSDQSAFTRQFKATTGLTPTEYRRSADITAAGTSSRATDADG